MISVSTFSITVSCTGPITDLKIGTWVNAIELVTNPYYVELWDMFLWKLTAEAVDLATTVPSWLRHTSQGQQKNNPDVIGGNGSGSASGDIKDVKFKLDIQMQDRIDPLITRMESWICKRKGNYPLFDKPCPCDDTETAVAYKRKTDIVFGIYDDDTDDCNCAPINSNDYVSPARVYHNIGDEKIFMWDTTSMQCPHDLLDQAFRI